jgi:hypothetical protein
MIPLQKLDGIHRLGTMFLGLALASSAFFDLTLSICRQAGLLAGGLRGHNSFRFITVPGNLSRQHSKILQVARKNTPSGAKRLIPAASPRARRPGLRRLPGPDKSQLLKGPGSCRVRRSAISARPRTAKAKLRSAFAIPTTHGDRAMRLFRALPALTQ